MKVIDLFAGVGGISQGFIDAGFEIEFAVEYEKEIADSYKKNHKNTHVYNCDISTINIEELVKFHTNIDVIVGGPPCQGFSQKGKRLSLDDDRNYLYKRFVDFVRIFRPSYFLMENVPNIITTSNGYFRDEILKSFNSLGYEVDNKILNSADFGVPQDRKRAFFLGKLGNKKLMLPKGNKIETTIRDAIYDLPFIESGCGKTFYEYTCEPFSAYQKIMRRNSKGIYNHIATKHSDLVIKRLSLIPKGGSRSDLPIEHHTKSVFSGTWTRLKEEERATTITTRFDTPSSGMFTHPTLNRCLTTREAARIQSFPDRFIFYGSKTMQMKQVGNAVPPILAENIANVIYKDILK